jgi:short-subunit dehydrogenase
MDSMRQARRTCLITGASSGIGHATALELIRAGHVVYGAARRVERMNDLRAAGGHVLGLDISDPAAIERAVRSVLDEQGHIDVLVNNAGLSLHGAVEDSSIDRARSVFEINLFGPARLTQLVLPQMRERGSGTIVNVSSIGGEIAAPLSAWYYASKHALEAYSDSLRQELRPFGVDVVIIQPGIIRTEFEKEMPRELLAVSGRGAYRGLAEKMAAKAETAMGPGTKASDPLVIARAIRAAVETASPKPRYAVGYLATVMLLLNRLLPDRAFDRLVSSNG